MTSPRERRLLQESLEGLNQAIVADDRQALTGFFLERADFRTTTDVVRDRDGFLDSAPDLLRLRASADVLRPKWLSDDVALVDGVFNDDGGRGWFTEVWRKTDAGDSYASAMERFRFGSSADAFQALEPLQPSVVADDDDLRPDAEVELRQQFAAFRAAFNAGDSRGVMALFRNRSDAITVFSFLEGRAQVLQGQRAVGDKAERMAAGELVINPARAAGGAMFAEGEPKVIRFLSDNVAVVDGTASIRNIPRAHGFAPDSMQGVYTDVWVRDDDGWLMQATRPWF